jgi:two-component system cell cycle response regulator
VRVLVVDDQWPMRLLCKVNLESDLVEVLEAESGPEAVEVALRELPDVILLDVMMPGMDGFEVAEILTADPRTSRIPIVFLSARADYASQARGLSIGAGDYITKPFNPTNLLEAIERLLGDMEAGRLDELRARKLERLQALFGLADRESARPPQHESRPRAADRDGPTA